MEELKIEEFKLKCLELRIVRFKYHLACMKDEREKLVKQIEKLSLLQAQLIIIGSPIAMEREALIVKMILSLSRVLDNTDDSIRDMDATIELCEMTPWKRLAKKIKQLLA